MLTDSKIFKQDIDKIMGTAGRLASKLSGDILITGATGLIGSQLAYALLESKKLNPDLRLHLLVRSREKAERLFGDALKDAEVIVGDVTTFDSYDGNLDYVIHAASQTASKEFVTHPVEVTYETLTGTKNLLALAKEKNVRKFVYLSTMEVYGTPQTDEKIREDRELTTRSDKARNCYPLSKILCENLCLNYFSEYGLNTVVLRLTQTFGAGVNYNDGRVFAEFARCVVENRDIVLKTLGETKRNYLYTADAVKAILLVLTKDEANGEIYNVANEDTYCSIAEMAEMVAEEIAGGKINVKYELSDTESRGYAPTLKMNLATDKLKALGFKAETGLCEAFGNLIEWMREQKPNE